MDPFTGLFALWLVYQLLKRLGEDAMSGGPDASRPARIKMAGFAPSSRGGRLGRYLGGLWKDAVAGAKAKSAARAAAGGKPSWLRSRLDEAAARWAGRQAPATGGGDTSSGSGSATSTTTPPAGDTDVDTQRPPYQTGEAVVTRDTSSGSTSETVAISGGAQPVALPAGPASSPADGGGAGEPILVGAVVGAATATTRTFTTPQPAIGATPTAEIEGRTSVSSTAIEVTGVSSGAAAAGRLSAAMAEAAAEYRNRLAQIQAGMYALAEAAHSNVELKLDSSVMQALATAHETAAVATRAALAAQDQVCHALNMARMKFLSKQ